MGKLRVRSDLALPKTIRDLSHSIQRIFVHRFLVRLEHLRNQLAGQLTGATGTLVALPLPCYIHNRGNAVGPSCTSVFYRILDDGTLPNRGIGDTMCGFHDCANQFLLPHFSSFWSTNGNPDPPQATSGPARRCPFVFNRGFGRYS
ncbi:MAG: hypothetical protein JJE04_21900 [Acidobacteriia bacterium]|nr:hypothetical protein [Terriglobia bacterium]